MVAFLMAKHIALFIILISLTCSAFVEVNERRKRFWRRIGPPHRVRRIPYYNYYLDFIDGENEWSLPLKYRSKGMKTKTLGKLIAEHSPFLGVDGIVDFIKQKPYDVGPFFKIDSFSTLCPSIAREIFDGLICIGTVFFHCDQYKYYPRAFRNHIFDGENGARLVGKYALQSSPAPTVILLHGLSGDIGGGSLRNFAIRAYKKGFNVAVMDMRGHGKTLYTCKHPMSGSWMEGYDVIHVARFMRKFDVVSKIYVAGLSMGGAVALQAAYRESESKEGLFDAAATISSPFNVMDAVSHLDNGLLWIFKKIFFEYIRDTFAYFLSIGKQQKKLTSQVPNDRLSFKNYIKRIVLPFYDFNNLDEFFEKANVSNIIEKITIPVLSIHSKDDPVVKYKTGIGGDIYNPNIHRILKRWGGHFHFITTKTYGHGRVENKRFAENAVLDFFDYLYWSEVHQISKTEF